MADMQGMQAGSWQPITSRPFPDQITDTHSCGMGRRHSAQPGICCGTGAIALLSKDDDVVEAFAALVKLLTTLEGHVRFEVPHISQVLPGTGSLAGHARQSARPSVQKGFVVEGKAGRLKGTPAGPCSASGCRNVPAGPGFLSLAGDPGAPTAARFG